MIIAIFGLTSWRPGAPGSCSASAWRSTRSVTPSTWSRPPTAPGRTTRWVNALWPASSLLVGLAAWQPVRRASALKDQSLRVVIVPVVCGVGAVGLLTYDHFSRLNGLTVTLAGVTLLLVLVRTALVFVENQRVLAHSRREALTDPLTGLSNRRSLMADLDDQLPRATPEQRVALVLFDLDGFKEYNDAFGHPAGDGLLDAAGRAPRRRRPGARGRLSARRRRVLRGAAPRCGRPGRAGGRLRRRAGRARRGLRGDDLARGRRGAGGGHGGHRGAADRRPAHVCPQG